MSICRTLPGAGDRDGQHPRFEGAGRRAWDPNPVAERLGEGHLAGADLTEGGQQADHDLLLPPGLEDKAVDCVCRVSLRGRRASHC